MKAKKAGMSHEQVKKEQSEEAHRLKKLANKDMSFGKKEGLKTKDQIMAQRLKDMNDPTTELGKATARAARKAAKEAEEFLLRTKGISIKQKEVPEGVDPKTILCEYFKHGCCAKTAEKCRFSHKMEAATRKGGNDATASRNIYDDDEADEADTMQLWDQAKLESVIAKKHGKEANSSNETTIVCKHFLKAVEKHKYGWFWNCPGGANCKYKHKLPKNYVFKADLVAMMREAAMNRKSDQDELREELEKLKASGPGTPVTLDVFLEWKTNKVEARRARDEKAKAERQKKGIFTGKELCEAADMSHGADEGSAEDDVEFAELRRLRKLAEEEEEKRVAAEATAALEKAKASGFTYGEEELDWGISTDELNANKPEGTSARSTRARTRRRARRATTANRRLLACAARRRRRRARRRARRATPRPGRRSARARRPRRRSCPRASRKRRCSRSPRRVRTPPRRWTRCSPRTRRRAKSTRRSSAAVWRRRRRRRRGGSAHREGAEGEGGERGAQGGARAAKKAEKEKGKKKKGEDEVTTLEEAMKGVSVAAAEAEGAASGALTKSALKRTVTGVLASRPTSRDIKIINFSMGMNGRELVQDCTIEVTIGRRYGLLGQNGCGKTNFLECLANREVPIPEHIDMYHLNGETEPTSRSAIQTVIDEINAELGRLNKLEEHILENFGPEDERLEAIYERLEEIDPTTFESRASELLHALGFSETMIHRATEDMSGGWRMRVALAKALFAAPTLLLLDEPTNHLDLEACVWLEGYLAKYKKCLILVSHSQDFLNGVCTHIIWMTQGTLRYYTGNFDTYVKTVRDDEIVQQKKYEKEQADIKHLKEFIASCGTYANARKQAESKQKIIDKMIAAGLTPAVTKEKTFTFRFPECSKVPPPVLPFDNVSFAYDGKPEHYLYKDLDFGVDCDSRIALVGPNGAGKSTLLKLMTGELTASKGSVTRHPALLIGKYHQHSVEVLDQSKNRAGLLHGALPQHHDVQARPRRVARVPRALRRLRPPADHAHRRAQRGAAVPPHLRHDLHAEAQHASAG